MAKGTEAAKRLDELAAQVKSLEEAQALSAEADRLRRFEDRRGFLGSFNIPLLRN